MHARPPDAPETMQANDPHREEWLSANTPEQAGQRNAASLAMDRYAAGDDRAFGELYDLLSPRLYGFLIRKVGDQALAEDLVQQTLMQMHCARATYVSGADVVPWAFAICRRLIIDAWRKQRKEALSSDGEIEAVAHVVAGDLSPDAQAEWNQALVSIEEALAKLPESQREAFVLLKQEGLSLAQAAETLGTTVGNVKVRAHRAYEALRQAVGVHRKHDDA